MAAEYGCKDDNDREHSLNKSCDSLPVCLVMRRGNSQEVVGFSQIVAVQGKDLACLFESVIIRQDLRGTGLGRRLMEATEDFARQKQMKTVYLNTLDKADFYTHLGYLPCQAVTSLGANASRVSEEFLQKLVGGGSSTRPTRDDCLPAPVDRLCHGDHGATCSPSPSLPPHGDHGATCSPSPSLPPPPPPPPPPPSTAGSSQGSQAGKDGVSRHVLRMDPSAVTWMCKHL
ncbi:N-alpha-acetyltransferase 80-like isoform X2 [Babylonia areolata]|uniref:N-alpha-acetyltransferase 80-like isoform X2 n=1 Tax=Babylonia areolata TaxID=304850 RepID=UPI003FD5D8DE